MRIGIITFHRANNFGAALQVYALSRFLSDLGHNVYIIDYFRLDSQSKKLFSFHVWKTAFQMIYRNPFSLWWYAVDMLKQRISKTVRLEKGIRNQKENRFATYFAQFLNTYLKLTSQTYNSPDDLRNNPPDMDVYIAGSDQIWGPGNTTFSPAFYLNFGKKEVRRISYAPSFGVAMIDKRSHNDLKGNISRFDAVSVREKSGVKIIEDICKVKATHTLDPTLLVDDYSEITEKPEGEDEFIFVYRLHQNDRLTGLMNTLIKNVANKCSLKVKTVSTTDDFSRQGEDLIVGVEGFLGLIAHSKMIITNSFHGTVLAILHRKPFICYPRNDEKQGQDERMIEFLSDLGLMSRYFNPDKEFEIGTYISDDIDWPSVFEILAEKRKHSVDYLKNALCV